jgi:hypothetical protein
VKDETEIDLSKSEEEFALFELSRVGLLPGASRNIQSKKGSKTKETLLAAGRSIDCVVAPFTVTTNITLRDGETADLTFTDKKWTSKIVPVAGIVKQEMDVTAITRKETVKGSMTMTLAAFGNDPAIVELAKKRKELEEEERIADAKRRVREEERQIAEGKRRVQEDERRIAEERQRADERRRIMAGATDLKEALQQSGSDQLRDFVQYGNRTLRNSLEGAQRTLNNADGFGRDAAQARVDTARAAIEREQTTIAQKTFFGEYTYSVSNESVTANRSSFTMKIPVDFFQRTINERHVSFPMGSIASELGTTRREQQIVLTVSGNTNDVQELFRNRGNYQVRVWFTSLRYNSRDNGAEADVQRVEVVRVR